MGTIKINVSDLGKYQQALGRRFEGVVRRGLLSGAMACIPILQLATRTASAAKPGSGGANGAVNTGAFLRGWRAEKVEQGARVFNRAPHAAFVEEGRKPGKAPPVAPIIKWMKQRGIAKGLKGGAKKIAWLIARAIGRRGLLGRKVMERSAKEMEKVVQREVIRELDKALKE